MSCGRPGKSEAAPPALPHWRSATASLVPTPKKSAGKWGDFTDCCVLTVVCRLTVDGVQLQIILLSLFAQCWWFSASRHPVLDRETGAQWRATGMAETGEQRLREQRCSPWSWRGLKPTLHSPWGLQGPCEGSDKGNRLHTKTGLVLVRAAQPWDRTQRGGGTSILRGLQNSMARLRSRHARDRAQRTSGSW